MQIGPVYIERSARRGENERKEGCPAHQATMMPRAPRRDNPDLRGPTRTGARPPPRRSPPAAAIRKRRARRRSGEGAPRTHEAGGLRRPLRPSCEVEIPERQLWIGPALHAGVAGSDLAQAVARASTFSA